MLRTLFFFALALVSVVCVLPTRGAHTRVDTESPFHKTSLARAPQNKKKPTSTGGGIYQQWWDVLHYTITIEPNIQQKMLSGLVEIEFRCLQTNHLLQLDLQQPLVIDSVFELEFLQKGCAKRIELDFKTDGDGTIVNFQKSILKNSIKKILIYYHGKPKEAVNPPWDGGVVWSKDSLHQPFVSVACQQAKASVWMPCKSDLGDEPNKGIDIQIKVPDSLMAVSNGKLRTTTKDKLAKKTCYHWHVLNPINNYNINFTIGKLVHFRDTFQGLKGILPLDYWVLKYNIQKAKIHFKSVKKVLRCFEYWFGAYPFYEDGYKLIETPFLGMEHQSGIAYGNHYQNGYKGKDLSNTGWGLLWDFIIVHETGHEWFGNNLTIKNDTDMWVHESFTNYSETLFTEYLSGIDAGNEYCYGVRTQIRNEVPMIPFVEKGKESSSDVYYKGGNLIHTLRGAIYDDKKFRAFLTFLNKHFYHQTVCSADIQKALCAFFEYDFTSVLHQYLFTTDVPELSYYFEGEHTLMLRWENCEKDFNLPIITPFEDSYKRIFPTTTWQAFTIKSSDKKWWIDKRLEKLFYISMKQYR